MTTPFPPQPRRAGFTLIELTISLFVFGMMILLFGATFPVVTRAGKTGGNYAQAALLAQHKIDQLRQAKLVNLSAPKLIAAGIADASPAPTVNADGSVTCAFSNVDNLVDNGANKGFFPPGSAGTVTIGQRALPNVGGSAPLLSQAAMVTVTIRWQGGNQSSGAFSTHTIIAGN